MNVSLHLLLLLHNWCSVWHTWNSRTSPYRKASWLTCASSQKIPVVLSLKFWCLITHTFWANHRRAVHDNLLERDIRFVLLDDSVMGSKTRNTYVSIIMWCEQDLIRYCYIALNPFLYFSPVCGPNLLGLWVLCPRNESAVARLGHSLHYWCIHV